MAGQSVGGAAGPLTRHRGAPALKRYLPFNAGPKGPMKAAMRYVVDDDSLQLLRPAPTVLASRDGRAMRTWVAKAERPRLSNGVRSPLWLAPAT